ncbi:protein SAWADEE HOMEODOMAIN HOMOLOG 2-like [Phragmites australis]|uniref:protein SAWADEE HOMEODOMAIN HOMOLOG 2-like n=1 Tax=Phragmites australis TaxID=29695 RepID=UPI002D77FD76|nr:protein SAWADEE HOMEODOMAIN HOMOLOG 2-like [Phragmites australis]
MERRSSVRFSPSEIARMEKLAADRKERVFDGNFCQMLAGEFNRSAGRAGSRALQATQVQEWFLNKFPAATTKPTCLPTASQEKALASEVNVSVSEEKAAASEEKAAASEGKLLAPDTSISNNEDEVSHDFPIETRDKVPELEELEFEAKSAKDSAWYDIAIFLAHRRNKLGEVEVRVRYEGFGADEDEWVNVKKSIRQRSIPLESSQCRNIVEGDLVLCFREGNEEALHFDAHVLEIQRKQHDIRGCRCVFLVEYDHDQVQERVSLRRLSRRPKYF